MQLVATGSGAGIGVLHLLLQVADLRLDPTTGAPPRAAALP